MFGVGLSVPRSLLFLILQLVIGPLIIVVPGASAQVSPCIKVALVVGLGEGLRGCGGVR